MMVNVVSIFYSKSNITKITLKKQTAIMVNGITMTPYL